MPLTVGQLTAYLKLDKSGYTAGLKDAKAEAAGAGRAIADGAKTGADGLSQASKSAADLGVALEASGRRGTASLSSLAATARSVIPALGVGAILAKGFQRLESIDSAQAKLKGLGHDAGEVKTIMNDALASVKGTAFGLDEAASVAATAVAAGIQPGQQLESTLKLIADSAAIAGTGMGEMGSIFNKVAANGKLTTETMQQLQDQGIPVLVKLAEHYGVTNEAAQKMVTEGKVSFNDFAAVMQDTLGGSALKMGDTIKGTLDNTGAALSRLGAGILGPLVPAMQSAADLVIFLSDGFGKLPAPVRDATLALGAFIALQKIGLFSGLASGAGTLVTQLRLIKTEGLAASGAIRSIGAIAAVGGGIALLSAAVDEYNRRIHLADDITSNHETIVNSLAEAYRNANGAINEVVRNQARLDITSSFPDVVTWARANGVAMDTLVDAYLGVDGAAGGLRISLAALQGQQDAIGGSNALFGISLGKVGEAFGVNQDESKRFAAALQSFLTVADDAAWANKNLAEATDKTGDAATTAAGVVRSYGPTVLEAASAASRWQDEQRQGASTLRGEFATAVKDAADNLDRLKTSFQSAADAAASSVTSALGVASAQADVAQAMSDAQYAAKKSGDALFDSAGGFDLSSAAARGLVGDLMNYRNGAIDAASAAAQQAAANGDVAGAAGAAQASLDGASGAFVAMAMQILHVTRPQAEAIAAQLGLLQRIQIDDKTFTVTMVTRQLTLQEQIDDPRQARGPASLVTPPKIEAPKIPSIKDIVGNVTIPKSSGGGGGRSGGKSAAEKAAADAKRAAEKAAADAKRRAEEAARAEQQRQEAMARTIEGTLSQIGRAAQKPFELANMSLGGIVSQIARSERSLANALAKGLDPKAAKPLQDQLLGLAREAGKQFQTMQKQIATTDFSNLRNALSGTASDVSSAVDALIKDMRAVGASSSTIAAITAKEHQLTAAMDQRADVVKRLADAQSNLNSLLGQYDQRVAQVTSSMQSYASLTNLVSGTEMSGFGADTLIVSLKERATAAKEFTDGITKLKRAGLNDTTLNQLIDAGPASAANQVQALLGATSAQIQQVNQLTNQVFGSGNQLGKLSADSMYGQGISAAQAMVDGLTSQKDSLTSTIEHLADGVEVLAKADMKLQGQRAMDGLIDGLKSKDSELNKAMKGIGGGMLKTFKDSLGIHSPSKVMAEQVGVPIIDGIIAGMNSKALALDSTGIRISGNLAGGSAASGQSGAIAGAQGPIELQATIRFEGIDGPMAELFSKTARVEIKSANEAVQVRINQGGAR